MVTRLLLEEHENKTLSPFAAKASASKGRKVYEEECSLRTCFQRDRDRIIHCKAFRRLKQKTQVFISPQDDHFRTRLTHTLEVSQIARTISRALGLNEDLTEAIALGHDLGHTPFGHSGEKILNQLYPEGFHHNEQSVRVVTQIEKKGKGLNLTAETLDGILNHRSALVPFTLEGKVVRISDKFAYINHDIEDAIRAKILREDELPGETIRILGGSTSERINTMIMDTVAASDGKDDIMMSAQVSQAVLQVRQFLFDRVYMSKPKEDDTDKVYHVLGNLYEYYIKNPEELSHEYVDMLHTGEALERVVCDYIAGMTDMFAIENFTKIFTPKRFIEKM